MSYIPSLPQKEWIVVIVGVNGKALASLCHTDQTRWGAIGKALRNFFPLYENPIGKVFAWEK